MNRNVQKFMDEMDRLGLNPRVEAELVVYRIVPVGGAHAGVEVETGVSADELVFWPQAPPHWVHLSSDVTFSKTNSRKSTKQGWLKHSRQINGWGDAPPGICWTSHVRSILCEATA